MNVSTYCLCPLSFGGEAVFRLYSRFVRIGNLGVTVATHREYLYRTEIGLVWLVDGLFPLDLVRTERDGIGTIDFEAGQLTVLSAAGMHNGIVFIHNIIKKNEFSVSFNIVFFLFKI